jgi:dTDP-glucose 4,6-dehydratase
MPVNKRLLVTGAAGFIGSNFCHYYLKENPNSFIVALDILTYAGNYDSIKDLENNKNFVFVKADINDTLLIEDLLIDYKLDTIVNFAAESHVDRSIVDPDSFIKTNIEGTYSLLKAAKKIWLDGPSKIDHRFHHVSTDEVYGTLGPLDPPFSESTPYAPNSPYAASKAASDHLVRAYNKTYNLNTTISNCSNNYGPYQYPEKLIPLTILNILNNDPIPIYGDGLQIRDWLYVDDHCKGISSILENGVSGESYNIGGLNELNNTYVVRLICEIIDNLFLNNPIWIEKYPNSAPSFNIKSTDLIIRVEDRKGHDRRYSIDPTKIKNELNFAATTSFNDGIFDTINWYLENCDWWNSLLEKNIISTNRQYSLF